ncbi:MAG: PVC-type heme-binding CxxCH protein, partial [Isosphaeraceae bacterium]
MAHSPRVARALRLEFASGVPTVICQFIRRIAIAIVFSAITHTLLAQGYAPEQAALKMQVATGFEVELVAAEPLVRQPVAIEFDDRGRLWVVQYLQYPNPEGLKRVTVDRFSRTKYDRVPDPPPRGPKGADRITILEDTNGDGRMDRSKDFVTGLNLTSGIAFGHGGVFVLNVPYLLFYPDKNRDDVPDADPEVLLTGFGMEDAHSVANSLTWGPDGWLYGCQGSTVTANIRGIEFQQGVWRYHPVSKKFELFCEGGGNSWGLDFDPRGRLFYSTNWGGNILLHAVQGGYYIKSFGKHGELHNPHAYGYFDHAQHRNFTGGHVTVGGLVYQGGAFPPEYSGRYIAGDLLGHGVNWHKIENVGSTVRTEHGGSLVDARDNWFAPTDVTSGPDGAIYFSDWHDARTAHPDPDADWDRTNGRIYRLKYKGVADVKTPDFAAINDDDLIKLHLHKNQWQVRHARQELVRRFQNVMNDKLLKQRMEKLISDLSQSAKAKNNEMQSLESLWSLNCLGRFDETIAFDLLDSSFPAVRYWTLRYLGDSGEISEKMAHRLDDFAEQETDVWVRGQVASTAARLPAKYAVPIINANINRDMDNADPFLPLQWWWAVERHSISGRDEVMKRFIRPSLWKSKLGSQFLLPRLVRRYSAEGSEEGLNSVVQLIKAAPSLESRKMLWSSVLTGIQQLKLPGDKMQSWQAKPNHHELALIMQKDWKLNQDDKTLSELGISIGISEIYNRSREIAFSENVSKEAVVRNLGLLKSAAKPELVSPGVQLFEKSGDDHVRRASLELL